MSHLRIWRSGGVTYFAGQLTALPGFGYQEGQFRSLKASARLHDLATDFAQPEHAPSRTESPDDAEGR